MARPERERQILDVAGRTFAEYGYAGTSLAQIAAAAEISKPLIYSYFGSKEGLFLACLTGAGELITEVIERTAKLGLVGPQRAVTTLDQLYLALDEHRWMWALLRDPTIPNTPALAEQYQRYRTRMDAVGAEGVTEMLTAAGHTDPLDAAALTAVWNSAFEALVTWWIDHPDVTPAAMTARTIRLFGTVFGRHDLTA